MADRPLVLAGLPERLAAPLRDGAAGTAPPAVALMRLLAEAEMASEAKAALARALDEASSAGPATAARLREASDLLAAHPDAWSTVRAVLGGVDHHPPAGNPVGRLAHWAAVFDQAARISPEGSVALYSLGSPELLREATRQVVERLAGWGLLGPDRSVLDLGCGIGRFEEALSPLVRRIVGLDISGEMIARARERCRGLANVTLAHTDGAGLGAFADGSFDLVLAVDVFPYLVEAGTGLVDATLRDVARALRPGGGLLVLNYSYRGNPEADLRDLRHAGADHGFRVIRDGDQPFRGWDGRVFHLTRTGLAEGQL